MGQVKCHYSTTNYQMLIKSYRQQAIITLSSQHTKCYKDPFLYESVMTCASVELSRETEPTGHIYVKQEIYFKELVHATVEVWQA